MIKVETRISVPGRTSSASDSKGVSTYYIRGEARRHDTISPLGSRSALILHCDTGASYVVDFDHQEYYKLDASTRPSGIRPGREQGAAATKAPESSAYVVTGGTVEVGNPKKMLGHLARHFVTKVEESIPDSGSSKQEATEVIDGWYLTDVPQPATNCTPEDMMDQPSVWIGAPVLPRDGTAPKFLHTGPTPRGLAVKVKRSSDATILDRKVVDLSNSTVDPALFEVPKGFKEVARPQSHESSRP